jgi:hypothetical protein
MSGDWKLVLAAPAIFLIAFLLAAIVDKLTGRNGR